MQFSRSLVPLLCLLALARCGGQAAEVPTIVLVTATGLPDTTRTLRAQVQLNGIRAAAEEYPGRGGTMQFGLRLRLADRGQFVVDLEALHEDRCVAARGQGTVQVNGEIRVDLTVALQALPARECGGVPQYPLTVTRMGEGSGTIISEPVGIDCGSKCTAEFGKGQQVKLTVRADGRSRFTGWAGACAPGQGVPMAEPLSPSCTVTVNAAVSVTASFASKLCSASGWCWENPSPQGFYGFRVWASSKTDGWAVGPYGALARFDGMSWKTVTSGTTNFLNSVWGSGPNDVWFVGEGGTILRWDGSSVKSVPSGTGATLLSVWGTSAGNAWAAGFGIILRWDGTRWIQVATPVGEGIYDIWGFSPTDIWAVTTSGSILRYAGTNWGIFTRIGGFSGYGVWGTSSTNMYFIGYLNGFGAGALRWNGMGFSLEQQLRSNNFLYDIWGSGSGDVWVVGDRGTVMRYNGVTWSAVPSGVGGELRGVWGTGRDNVLLAGAGTILRYDGTNLGSNFNQGPTDALWGAWGKGSEVWFVGDNGTILYWNGTTLKRQESGTQTLLYNVWGSATNDIWAVGSSGEIVHYDGKAWSVHSRPSMFFLEGVWGSGPKDVWAVGNDIVHWDGTEWKADPRPPARGFWGIHGSAADNVWAVGFNGVVARWNGSGWSAVTGTGNTTSLTSVWTGGPNDVWAVGYNGTSLRFDGNAWTKLATNTNVSLYSITGFAQNDIYAVGHLGTILHWSGTAWQPVTNVTSNFALLGLFGASPSELWAVGYGGTVLRNQK